MRQFLLITLFAILLSDIMLDLGLTLGPGLSLKNAMLYLVFLALILEFTLGASDPLRETWALNATWLLLVSYAVFTWLVIILLGVHRGYSAFAGFIALKAQLIDLFLFLLVYMYAPKDAVKSINLLRWLISILVVVNVVTLVDVFNLPDLGIITDREDGRLTGPVNEVNQYGAILIFIIPITAGLALSSTGWLKRLFVIGALMAFVLLGLTVSRGSYLGLAVGGLLALYLVRHHVRREAIVNGSLTIAITLIVVAAAIAYQNPEGFLAKFDFVGTSLDRASSGRIDFWRQALTMMSYWPYSFVVGYGWDAYATLFLGYGDPHNTYLLYWFNLGIVGLGLYVFIVVWIVRFCVTSLDALSESLRPVIIGFIMGFLALHVALFFVGLYASWLFIWAITGAALRLVVEDVKRGDLQATELQESGER
jgi:O-antigen ligase